nr:DDT domain-containing protein [Tanacetum cinerariifolium]
MQNVQPVNSSTVISVIHGKGGEKDATKVEDVDDLHPMQSVYLGSDRRYNRYWLLLGPCNTCDLAHKRIYFESSEDVIEIREIIVVVACKMIALIPIFLVLLKSMYSDKSIVLEQNPENNNDHTLYVLQLQDGMELSERTLKSIFNYVDCPIQKAKKRQSDNLIKLLEESISFAGVGKYDILQDPTSPEAYLDC